MSEFSVLMSVYGKEKASYLESCLESLVKQSMQSSEIVLVLDGPIGEELHIVIKRYRDILNIVLVPLKNNIGLARALNEGLMHCRHDLVVRMDTDDIAMPDRFKIQVGFMEENPDIAVSSGYILEFTDDGNIISERILPLEHDELVRFSRMRNPLSHPAVVMRKNAILSAGGYPNVYPEDYMMWIKILQAGFKIANIPEVLVKMRTGEDFISRRGWRFLKGELKIYHYMYTTGFISFLQFIKISIIKTVLRLSPGFIKVLFYKKAR